MRAAALAVLLLACGKSAPSSSDEGAKTPPAQPPAQKLDPVAKAHEALKADWKLDYELPMADKSRDRKAIAAMFLDTCKAGDRPSCWKAAAVAEPADRDPIVKLVEANCVGGDKMSCRALPQSPPDAFPKAPGAAGRSSACDPGEPMNCDRKVLRDECSEGFPRSCVTLMMIDPPEPDREALLERALELSREGCEAWIPSECEKIADHDGDPRQEVALGRVCELERSCIGYAAFVLDTDKDKARDYYERTCEYDPKAEMICESLAVKYLDGVFREPVKGRGQVLLDWSCARSKKAVESIGMDLFERQPACKRMTK